MRNAILSHFLHMHECDFSVCSTVESQCSQVVDVEMFTFKSLLRTTVPFVTAHLEIFHCTHHPVIPKSDLYFTFCSTLNALSKRTSK